MGPEGLREFYFKSTGLVSVQDTSGEEDTELGSVGLYECREGLGNERGPESRSIYEVLRNELWVGRSDPTT